MLNPFFSQLLPSLFQAGGQAGVGGLQGLAQGPLAAEEYRKQLDEREARKQEAAMRALNLLAQQRALTVPQPFHFAQGSVFGTIDPATGRMSQVRQVPLQPHPLAPETAEMERKRGGYYEAQTKLLQGGGGLRPTSRVDELIARKEARGEPLTAFEQKYKEGKLAEKQQLAEIISGVRQREKAAAPASFTERKFIANLDALKSAADKAMSLMNDEWIGPIAGYRTQLALRTGIGLQPNMASFVANYSSVKNRFVHELYGSALTPGEIQRAIQQFPELTDPPQVFREKMIVTKEYIERMKQAGSKQAVPAARTPTDAVIGAKQRFEQLIQEGTDEDEAYRIVGEEFAE